jgi:hypothetical protein
LARSNFTTLEKLMTLMRTVTVSVSEKNQILLNVMGKSVRYVEIEPGLLQNPENPDDRILLKVWTAVYLYPTSPFVFIKLPRLRPDAFAPLDSWWGYAAFS